ncbi:MAG TPA: TetR/AcrR family transcriptional regulator [Solirubrobacterales bacterium]|nr:TetR/AcrR family transcriptional regulator [Solirubrobacterales bacterium]
MARGPTRADDGEGGGAAPRSVLTPSVPQDIGIQAQRQRILEAMAKSCAEKTFSATTIADIVSHASISRATFYKHFANKQDCFYATADTFLLELQGAAAVAYTRSGDSTVEMVRDVIAAVLEALAADPDQARMLLVEAPIVDAEIVRRYRGFAIAALEKLLRAGGVAGQAQANPEIAFGRAKVLITNYVAADQVEDLGRLLPDLVYIALLPYAGQETALAQAKASR